MAVRSSFPKNVIPAGGYNPWAVVKASGGNSPWIGGKNVRGTSSTPKVTRGTSAVKKGSVLKKETGSGTKRAK